MPPPPPWKAVIALVVTSELSPHFCPPCKFFWKKHCPVLVAGMSYSRIVTLELSCVCYISGSSCGRWGVQSEDSGEIEGGTSRGNRGTSPRFTVCVHNHQCSKLYVHTLEHFIEYRSTVEKIVEHLHNLFSSSAHLSALNCQTSLK